MATTSGAATGTPRAHRLPISISITAGNLWLAGAIIVSLMLYYFIGVDQGALSVFGNNMDIHEFVHDSRHFLGFPCH
jgi:hypothetical protein